jgi:hypothetical protein
MRDARACPSANRRPRPHFTIGPVLRAAPFHYRSGPCADLRRFFTAVLHHRGSSPSVRFCGSGSAGPVLHRGSSPSRFFTIGPVLRVLTAVLHHRSGSAIGPVLRHRSGSAGPVLRFWDPTEPAPEPIGGPRPPISLSVRFWVLRFWGPNDRAGGSCRMPPLVRLWALVRFWETPSVRLWGCPVLCGSVRGTAGRSLLGGWKRGNLLRCGMSPNE